MLSYMSKCAVLESLKDQVCISAGYPQAQESAFALRCSLLDSACISAHLLDHLDRALVYQEVGGAENGDPI